MPRRTFPATGNANEDEIKTKAGYVEYAVFRHQKGGYFCGTCPAFDPESFGQRGFCEGLKVPVVTYACCNNWRLAPDREDWIGADGSKL